jgi:hypothetical protein
MTAAKNPMPLTFIVGSGRCGSTMMSRVLREHPDVLSVSELFHHEDMVPTFDRPSIDGPEIWRWLSTPQPLIDALFSSGTISEMRYPHDGRFKPDTGIPLICHGVLPMLSKDPDTLFDLLAAEVPTWPSRSAADHYRSLFGLLGQHLGKRVTVERTGGSILMVKPLREQFPEARFVYIHRDGPDCAVSMSRHPMFRLRVLKRMLRWMLPGGLEGISEEVRGLIAPPIDIKRLMSFPIPLTFFGNLWSFFICQGLPVLAELPPGGWTRLRYEDVLADPAAELTRLADFIGVTATPQWLAAATALTGRSRPVNISAELAPKALAAVQKACMPGTEAIAAAESRLYEAAGMQAGRRPGV